MKSSQKIAILGGSGKSGKFLVKQLLDQGYSLRVFLRHPAKLQISHPLLEIVEGDAREYSHIHTLLQGCEAVISTLGQRKGEPLVFSQATIHLIQAMQELQVHRYILVAGLNLDTAADKKGLKSKLLTRMMKWAFPTIVADKQKEYQTLLQSNINWTVVRLPLIEETDRRGEIRVSTLDCPGKKISTADLADFLVRQLTDTSYMHKAPFIANA